MSKEKAKKDEMKEKRQQIINELRTKRQEEIEESGLNIKIINIDYIITLNELDEKDGEKLKDIFEIIEEREGEVFYKYYDEDLKLIAARVKGEKELIPGEEEVFKNKDERFLENLNKIKEVSEAKKDNLSEQNIEEKEDAITGKPQNVIQYIDVDKAYVDDKNTFRKAYGIPAEIKELAIRGTTGQDKDPLSSNLTIDMVDKNGNKVEKIKIGEKELGITDFFEVDDATGSNPMYDDNTKLELDKTVEKNRNHTMGRFISKKNPSLYLSIEQKDVGSYPEVYSGRKTKNGNDPVEIQLETRNEPIQTSLEMQKINRMSRGNYSADQIDKEADFHEEHGDDIDNINRKNADGDRTTFEICDDDKIPGTDITWREFANNCGYRGENGLEQAKEKFIEYKKEYPNLENKELVDNIVEDLEGDMPGFKENR